MRFAVWTLLFCISAFGADGPKAFTGARVIDGTGKAAVENATIVVRNGRIEAVGRGVRVPDGAERIDLSGKTVIPGLINAHGHVANLDQLGLYARYGVTTVFSLGGDREVELRDKTRAEQGTPSLTHARLFIAGPIPTSRTAEEGRKAVEGLAAAKVDVVKMRIDDQLGRGQKMPAEAYTAIIQEAHKRGMRVAIHIVTLADAKAVLKLGADIIAHSVRDQEIDAETIALMKKAGTFYIPTFLREVSTFAYADKPSWLSDPFLTRDGNKAEMARAADPAFQESMRGSADAKWYREHLPLAMRNMKKVFDAGVPVAMGTDTGPPQRFQGYFEHLELEYMVNAGLTPMQTIVAATATAAKAIGVKDVGTIEVGKWGDFVVLGANPLEDIRNTRKMESAWVAGNRVPGP